MRSSTLFLTRFWLKLKKNCDLGRARQLPQRTVTAATGTLEVRRSSRQCRKPSYMEIFEDEDEDEVIQPSSPNLSSHSSSSRDEGVQYKFNTRTSRNMKGKRHRYGLSNENDSSASAEWGSEESGIVEEESDMSDKEEMSSAAIPVTWRASQIPSKRRAAAVSMNGNCLMLTQ